MFKKIFLTLSLLWFANLPAANAQIASIGQDAKPAATSQTKSAEGRRVFGDWMFSGQFANRQFIGFNPDYEVASGDKITLQLWGGFEFQGEVTVDAQGNIFLPKVGPIMVRGVRNEGLNEHVTKSVAKVFKSNVGVYASLVGAEPVKVFVTGYVKKPGLYAGHSSDSVLRFVDMAGGITSGKGSYISLDILRRGEVIRQVNLYDFLLEGKIPSFQIFDGDTILIKGVNPQIGVLGLVQNPFVFEFVKSQVSVVEVLKLARPTSRANSTI